MTPGPHIPVSWGELFDKFNILEIKLEKLSDPTTKANVAYELGRLQPFVWTIDRPELLHLRHILGKVNRALWDLENAIRRPEGPDYVELARGIYRLNDERARIKREINLLLGSVIVEEKLYD